MPSALAQMIQTASTAKWFAVLIHPRHFDQAHDEFQETGAMLVSYKIGDDRFMGLVTPDGRGCLLGTSTTVPQHSVAHIADGDSLLGVAESTRDALDRLAAGVDRLAEPRSPRPRHAG